MKRSSGQKCYALWLGTKLHNSVSKSNLNSQFSFLNFWLRRRRPKWRWIVNFRSAWLESHWRLLHIFSVQMCRHCVPPQSITHTHTHKFVVFRRNERVFRLQIFSFVAHGLAGAKRYVYQHKSALHHSFMMHLTAITSSCIQNISTRCTIVPSFIPFIGRFAPVRDACAAMGRGKLYSFIWRRKNRQTKNIKMYFFAGESHDSQRIVQQHFSHTLCSVPFHLIQIPFWSLLCAPWFSFLSAFTVVDRNVCAHELWVIILTTPDACTISPHSIIYTSYRASEFQFGTTITVLLFAGMRKKCAIIGGDGGHISHSQKTCKVQNCLIYHSEEWSVEWRRSHFKTHQVRIIALKCDRWPLDIRRQTCGRIVVDTTERVSQKDVRGDNSSAI